jgi:hypothetical protein
MHPAVPAGVRTTRSTGPRPWRVAEQATAHQLSQWPDEFFGVSPNAGSEVSEQRVLAGPAVTVTAAEWTYGLNCGK